MRQTSTQSLRSDSPARLMEGDEEQQRQRPETRWQETSRDNATIPFQTAIQERRRKKKPDKAQMRRLEDVPRQLSKRPTMLRLRTMPPRIFGATPQVTRKPTASKPPPKSVRCALSERPGNRSCHRQVHQ